MRSTRYLIGLSILVLLLSNLKGLASLQRALSSHLALLAFQTEDQLLGLLGLQITPKRQHAPSCGKWAWSDLHNPSASYRIDAFLRITLKTQLLP